MSAFRAGRMDLAMRLTSSDLVRVTLVIRGVPGRIRRWLRSVKPRQ
jgi:hypothetical protein